MGALFSGALSAVAGALSGVWGYVAAGAFSAVVAGASVGWTVHRVDAATIAKMELADANARAAAIKDAAEIEAAQDQVSTKIAVDEAAAERAIAVRTVTITKEVPVYVSQKSDADCVLPDGFIKLLDAAGLAADPDSLPGAAGEPDDAASGLRLSQAAALLAQNLGAARGNAEQLKALEAWVKDEEKTTEGK